MTAELPARLPKAAPMDETRQDAALAAVFAALRKRAENGGRHLHHRDCIHNLPPEEQVMVRGRTVEWWLRLVGPLPVQISSAEWVTEPPEWPAS